MMAHPANPRTQETMGGGMLVWGQPGLQGKLLAAKPGYKRNRKKRVHRGLSRLHYPSTVNPDTGMWPDDHNPGETLPCSVVGFWTGNVYSLCLRVFLS